MKGWPHHGIVRRLCHRFNADPKFQYKLHLVATYMWLVNMAAATAVFFLFPGFWSRFSIFYVVLISLYANFATDYGSVPGAIAAIHAESIDERDLSSSNRRQVRQRRRPDGSR